MVRVDDLLSHYWWQVAIILAVAILTLGTLLVVVGVACFHLGRRQAPDKAREERDAARLERDVAREEADKLADDNERLRGELATAKGISRQIVSTAARLMEGVRG